MHQTPPIADMFETGSLGIYHLKSFWSKLLNSRAGQYRLTLKDFYHNRIVSDTLGIGQLQVSQYLFGEAPNFETFESWIVETAGKPSLESVERINAFFEKRPVSENVQKQFDATTCAPPVLSDADLNFWEEHGYVVLKNAISESECKAAQQAIWEYIGADPNDPKSWHKRENGSIMLELYQHPALHTTRHSPRIRKAFAQLWKRSDLWCGTDRCSFHPPHTSRYDYPGPDLHWDVNFDLPFCFATQGLLYLSDTPPERGALRVVPGFQHRFEAWLAALPEGADPQAQDLYALGPIPIGGEAGDLIIWHHALPHGPAMNLSSQPRLAQYLNYYAMSDEGYLAEVRPCN